MSKEKFKIELQEVDISEEETEIKIQQALEILINLHEENI